MIENGVDIDRFAVSGSAPRPDVCVYVGAFDARFDWEQTRSWAAGHPQWRFVLAGPGASPSESLPDNVDVVGPVPYEDLPGLLSGARVGMLPLSSDPLNRGRSPMKLYEYLAAGLAVVSRETPVLHAAPEDGVYTYADEGEASVALRAALEHATPNRAGAVRARTQSWTAKRDVLRDFIASLPARRRRPVAR